MKNVSVLKNKMLIILPSGCFLFNCMLFTDYPVQLITTQILKCFQTTGYLVWKGVMRPIDILQGRFVCNDRLGDKYAQQGKRLSKTADKIFCSAKVKIQQTAELIKTTGLSGGVKRKRGFN